MHTFIVGGGFLGSKIQDYFSQNGVQTTTTSFESKNFEKLDIMDKKAVEKFFSYHKPENSVLCASMSDVEQCEAFPEKARLINVEGTRNVFEACRKNRSRLVFISSDYVFDGLKGNYSETDTENPMQVYGRTKLEGEKIVLQEPENLVVRVSTLYGSSSVMKKTFHWHVVERLSKGVIVPAAFDQVTSPTLIDDVAIALFSLVEKNKSGLFHCAGNQALTRYGFAQAIAKKYGFDEKLVKKVSMREFNWRAKRPADSSLSIKKLNSHQVFMKNVDQGLTHVLNGHAGA
ncbi:MAG: SDR family oxidoreductase [archaeon]|nr:SDR family oxidoreductase [archaeon]